MYLYPIDWARLKGRIYPLILTSLLLVGLNEPALAQDQKALFVVGNPSSLNASDQAMKDWMETDLDYLVSLADDDGITESASDGHDIIFISSTVNSGKVNTTFTNTPIPLFVWEYALFDDLGLIDPNGTLHNEYGMTSGTSIEFVNPSDPMSGGNSGTTAFFTTPTDKVWAQPNANATIIAQKPGNPDKITYFRYDAGAQMYNGITAPATRGILPLSDNAAINLTIDAFETIKAGIRYVLPPFVASLYNLEAPICVLEEFKPATQAFAGKTLPDGSSVIIGSTTTSPRFHYRYNYTLDTGGKIIIDTVKGSDDLVDTVTCQAINVPGFPEYNQYIDCNSLDLNNYTITNTQYFPITDYDVLASRIKADGTIMWTRSFGSYGMEYFHANLGQNITIADDGNILMTMGQAWRESQPLRSIIFKLDVDNGDLLWSKYAPMVMGDDRTKNIYKTADNHLLTTGPSIEGGWKLFLHKLDQDANFVFGKFYQSDQHPFRLSGEHVFEASDGSYMLNASGANSSNYLKGHILNVSSDGTVVNWAKKMAHTDPTIDDQCIVRFVDMKEHPQGGYVATGFSDCDANQRELLIGRLNSDGSLAWVQSYAHPTESLTGMRIEIGINNDLIVTGFGSTQNFLARVDENNGNLDWLHAYAPTAEGRVFSLEVVDLLKIVVLTHTANRGALLMQFDMDGMPNNAYDCLITDWTASASQTNTPIVLNDVNINVGNTMAYIYEPLHMYEHIEDKGYRYKDACPGEIGPCGNDPLVLASPSQDQNYIMNYSLREEVQDAAQIGNLAHARDVHQSVSYLDGLGRNMQSVNVRISPDFRDIVSIHEYDKIGREVKRYIPFEDLNIHGSFRTNAQTLQQTELNTHFPGQAAFTESELESSPLGRILEQGQLGTAWQIERDANNNSTGNGNTLKFQYLMLGSSEIPSHLQVPYFTLGAGPNTSINQGFDYYAASTPALKVVKAEDENGSVSFSFTDIRGLTILKSQQMDNNGTPGDLSDDEFASVLNIYNEFGNLAYELQPEGFAELMQAPQTLTQDLLDRYAFQYQYDERQRIVGRKNPGKGWSYFVFNQLDQMVLAQDANQRMNGKDEWSFTKYDEFNRPILTGLYDNLLNSATAIHDPAALRTYVQVQTIQERRSNTSILDSKGETIKGYSNFAFPDLAHCEVHSISYYDDYNFDLVGNEDASYIQNVNAPNNVLSHRVNGLPTGHLTKVLDPNDVLLNDPDSYPTFLRTVTFYDERQREIQTQAEHLRGMDISTFEINFAGEIYTSITQHEGPQGDLDVINRFCFDHAGRVIRTTQQNNSDPEVVLMTEEFDFRDNVVDKKIHSVDGGQTFLQSVDYSYNIRNWLTGINQTNDMQAGPGSGVGDSQADVFGMELMYNTTDWLNNQPLYDGNISAVRWQQGTEDVVHAYNYVYDSDDRLKVADYYTKKNGTFLLSSLNRYHATYSYDLNSNLTSLKRYGLTDGTTYGLMDDLSYTYENPGSNRLLKVDDAIGTGSGNQFLDGGNMGDDFVYDENGNPTVDLNKNIQIDYNHFNKPIRITFTDGPNKDSWIDYIYDASGTKWQMRSTNPGNSPQITDYINGFTYQDESLEFFSHPEGRVKPDGSGGFDYQYVITDHLGNARVYIESNGMNASVIQIDAYYPFGMNISSDVGYPIANPENPYRYNGKEQQTAFGLGLYDYGARMYDPTTGRWNGVDPLAESYSAQSPYSYVMNNPIRLIDPDGMQVDDPTDPPSRYHMIDEDTAEGTEDEVTITGYRTTDGRKAAEAWWILVGQYHYEGEFEDYFVPKRERFQEGYARELGRLVQTKAYQDTYWILEQMLGITVQVIADPTLGGGAALLRGGKALVLTNAASKTLSLQKIATNGAKNLFANARLKPALEKTIEIAKNYGSPKHIEKATKLLKKYQKNFEKNLKGVITSEKHSVTNNKIIDKSLDLLNGGKKIIQRPGAPTNPILCQSCATVQTVVGPAVAPATYNILDMVFD